MRYAIQCSTCKEIFWIKGSFDPSVNALELDDNDNTWNEVCIHLKNTDSYEIIDEEVIEFEDNVI